MLSDVGIKKAYMDGDICIDPTPRFWNLQPASLDIHIGKNLLFYNSRFIDAVKGAGNEDFDPVEMKSYIDIAPGDFFLVDTLEAITLNNKFAARVEGKSSLARLGLQVHITAGFIDPGFSGTLTLEVANLARHIIRLHKHQRIAQLAFFRLEEPSENEYGSSGLGSAYQNAVGVEGSKGTRDVSLNISS